MLEDTLKCFASTSSRLEIGSNGSWTAKKVRYWLMAAPIIMSTWHSWHERLWGQARQRCTCWTCPRQLWPHSRAWSAHSTASMGMSTEWTRASTHRLLAKNTGNVHHSTIGLFQMRHDQLSEGDHALDVQLNHMVQCFQQLGIVNGTECSTTGTVDKHIDLAVVAHHSIDQALQIGHLGDIGHEGKCFRSIGRESVTFLHGLLDGILTAPSDHHGCPLLGKLLGSERA